MKKANKDIIIGYDDCGFSIEIGDKNNDNDNVKIFESDYCGFPRKNEMYVIKYALEYLGHNVELKYAIDDNDDEVRSLFFAEDFVDD